MREEYTRETYPSFGKKYDGEKAIISLTSWKARINTVGLTIFSLIKNCPGFHIVLVLSEEEFPRMMDEMPQDIKMLAEAKLIEVLWVYRNYKSGKKVCFTMDKYQDITIISADDDCLYTKNYANELYCKSTNCDNNVVIYAKLSDNNCYHTQGPCTLYKTKNLNDILSEILLKMKTDSTNQDDSVFSNILLKYKISTAFVKSNPIDFPFLFHTTVNAINPSQYRTALKRFTV